MVALAYCTVGSNRLDEAKVFYDALLASAGVLPLVEHSSGGRVYGKDGMPFFGVLGPFDKKPATLGNGSMLGLVFDTTGEVDDFHAKALELGGTDAGAPGERAKGFYMSYVRDLDGNKICAFSIGG